MQSARHLDTSIQYVVYFDGSVFTIRSNSKLFFSQVFMVPYLYLNYMENEQ